MRKFIKYRLLLIEGIETKEKHENIALYKIMLNAILFYDFINENKKTFWWNINYLMNKSFEKWIF